MTPRPPSLRRPGESYCDALKTAVGVTVALGTGRVWVEVGVRVAVGAGTVCVGVLLGIRDGTKVGVLLGTRDGPKVGVLLGTSDSTKVGVLLGTRDGTKLGVIVRACTVWVGVGAMQSPAIKVAGWTY